MRPTPEINHFLLRSTEPTRDTIAVMGKTAQDAANTFAFREWAARLATQAGPRDYVGQLRALYFGILQRWRYVMEPGEWVHGTADSLIAHVLGTKYNGVASGHSNVSLASVSSKQKGWGDCDDVATVAAAGVLSLGMQPFFRVAKGASGGHVSVVARTPRGDVVSLDPVGHPEHDFGWMLPAPSIQYYDLAARQAPSLGCADCGGRCGCGPTQLRDWRGKARGSMPQMWVRTHDPLLPPAAITVPRGAMGATHVTDGCPGVDELGREFAYDASNDVWLEAGLSGWADVKRRWRKRVAAVRKVVKKVAKIARNVQALVLKSKVAQRLVAAALQVYGVPMRLTRGVMEASGEILKKGGLPALLKLLKQNPKAAMQLVAQAVKKGVSTAKTLLGVDSSIPFEIQDENGNAYHAHALGVLAEVPALPDWRAADSFPDKSAEANNASIAARLRPAEFATREGVRKGSPSDPDWLANVAYWATYPNGPVVIGKNRTYGQAWRRIKTVVMSAMRNSPTTPTKATPKTPVAFAISPREDANAKRVALDQPTGHVHHGVRLTQKPKQSLADWLTNVAYWESYPDGPTEITKKSDRGYRDAWMRINAVVVRELGVAPKKSTPKTTTPKTTTPKTTTPKKSTPKTTTPKKSTPKTTTPKTTIPTQTPSGSDCWEDVDRSVCVDFRRSPNEEAAVAQALSERPAAVATRQGRKSGDPNDRSWITNVAYWLAYPDGPVTIVESAPNYRGAWLRMSKLVGRAMVSTPKVPTRPTDTDPPIEPPVLPDVVDDRELECLRAGGQWDVARKMCVSKPAQEEKKTNWLPIAATVVAAFLLK